jgi:hypothetical protein
MVCSFIVVKPRNLRGRSYDCNPIGQLTPVPLMPQ